MDYHYTYLSINIYNDMKYIGVRSCSCLPNDDTNYMGSSESLKDLMKINPDAFDKIVLSEFKTREEAQKEEIRLHALYDVANNPEFYNLCNAGKYGIGEQPREVFVKGQVVGSNGVVFVKDLDRVLDVKSNKHKRYAEFICPACGKHFRAGVSTVKSGGTTSCGCMSSQNYADAKLKHYVYKKGDVLGDNGIAYLKELPHKYNEDRRAIFRCSCGKEFECTISAVKHNNTKSCGCARKGWNKLTFTKGEVIGDSKLSFLKEVTPDNNRKTMAKIHCHCGNTFEARISDIMSGKIVSCGCRTLSKSGYRGVQVLKNGKLRSATYHNSSKVHLGTFITIKEALEARNNYIKKHSLKLPVQELRKEDE